MWAEVPPAAQAPLRVAFVGSILFCRINGHKDTRLDPPNLDNAVNVASRSPALRSPHVWASVPACP